MTLCVRSCEKARGGLPLRKPGVFPRWCSFAQRLRATSGIFSDTLLGRHIMVCKLCSAVLRTAALLSSAVLRTAASSDKRYSQRHLRDTTSCRIQGQAACDQKCLASRITRGWSPTHYFGRTWCSHQMSPNHFWGLFENHTPLADKRTR